ncbi:MAG: aspartate-semialdehyde dehydrogenase [Desulfobacteraceae bacterium 4572_35.2]|nr:MAG: aspartate-semialdehyde dehydrogenase [Desulfobacteraceae bacterium 4572_35.2]
MYTLAVVGATGAVGRQIIEVLEERQFPVQAIRLLASERSVGEFVEFKDESVPVQLLGQDSFAGVDIAFFCATDLISEKFCPIAAAAGAICIDTSRAWRMDNAVPLVVPSINGEAASGYRAKRIIASPASSSLQLSLALKALSDFSALERVVVSTYQPVSENGQQGVDELRHQCGELLNGRPVKDKLYPHQVGFNCLPHVGDFESSGYTDAETGLVREVQKVLAVENLRVTATAVRVPVFYGLCQSVNVETKEIISVAKARELFDAMADVELVDNVNDVEYPMPIDASGQDSIYVGRIRSDESCDKALNMWVAADNLRQGSATNVVQIAELLGSKYL